MRSFSVREASGGYIIEISQPIDIRGFAAMIPGLTGLDEDAETRIEGFLGRLSDMMPPSSKDSIATKREIIAKDKEELLQKLTTIIGSW